MLRNMFQDSTTIRLLEHFELMFNVLPNPQLCYYKWKHVDLEKPDTQLTSSAAMVKQGQCFFVSLIFTVLAFWAVLRALERLSGANSRQISLASADTPSSWNSSKNLACRVTGGGVLVNTNCLDI